MNGGGKRFNTECTETGKSEDTEKSKSNCNGVKSNSYEERSDTDHESKTQAETFNYRDVFCCNAFLRGAGCGAGLV